MTNHCLRGGSAVQNFRKLGFAYMHLNYSHTCIYLRHTRAGMQSTGVFDLKRYMVHSMHHITYIRRHIASHRIASRMVSRRVASRDDRFDTRMISKSDR